MRGSEAMWEGDTPPTVGTLKKKTHVQYVFLSMVKIHSSKIGLYTYFSKIIIGMDIFSLYVVTHCVIPPLSIRSVGN